MRLWEENRRVLTGLGVALLVLLAVKFTVVNAMNRAGAGAEKSYSEKETKLKERRKGQYDIADATARMRKSNVALSRELDELTRRVEIPFHPWTEIAEEYREEPGVYFVKMHAQLRDELFIECQKAEVKLSDEWFGVEHILRKRELLSTREAEENLNGLSIAYRLVVLLAKAGVKEVVKMAPAPPVRTGPPGSEFIIEYPVTISVRTELDSLMRFLHEVRKPGEFFLVVRGLEIGAHDPYAERARGPRPSDTGELSVTIDAAGMRFVPEEELRAMRERARPRPKEEEEEATSDKPIGF
jgi:hypothetical protein